jgi:hypothetical protein
MNLADAGATGDSTQNVTVLHTWLIPVLCIVALWVLGGLVFRSIRV